MLESEVDRLLHDQAGHIERGEDLERYLAGIGKTEEEVREELRPIADIRLRRSLVLSKVAEAENIEVTGDDVDAEIEKMTASAGAQGAQLQAAVLQRGRARDDPAQPAHAQDAGAARRDRDAGRARRWSPRPRWSKPKKKSRAKKAAKANGRAGGRRPGSEEE